MTEEVPEIINPQIINPQLNWIMLTTFVVYVQLERITQTQF